MTVYALKLPDGRFAYHLPTPAEFGTPGFTSRATVTGVYADGQPMQALHSSWWATDREATMFTATAQPAPRTVGYRLIDPDTESVRYPATLALDQWQERSDRESETLWELYTSVQEDVPALEHVYEGPVTMLEGREPPGPDELKWVANLPQVLAGRPEYRHLFPGRIPGLRDRLHKLISDMPRVKYCFDKYEGYTGLHVVIRVPFEQPQTTWQRDISRRTGKTLKSGRNVPVTVERRLNLPVPADVAGDNYEAAVQAWEQQTEFWLSVVRDASVAACNACDGTGHVNHGSEQYSR